MNTPAKKPTVYFAKPDRGYCFTLAPEPGHEGGYTQLVEFSAYQSLLEQAESLERALENYFTKCEDGEWKAGWADVEKAREQFRAFKKKAGKDE